MAVVSFLDIFLNSSIAVAQLFAMAFLGISCTRIGLVSPENRKFLSELSFKVAIPCLLLTNILKCPNSVQEAGDCKSLSSTFKTAWPFFFLPFCWVFMGAVVGKVAVFLARTPASIRGTAMAACTFGNSTAVPIVLLTALSSMPVGNFHTPNANRLRLYLSYLSIYLTMYQVLLWTIGNWLLQRSESVEGTPNLTLTPAVSFARDEIDNPLIGTSDLSDGKQIKQTSFEVPATGAQNAAALLEAGVLADARLEGGDRAERRARMSALVKKLLGYAQNFFVPPVIAIFLGLVIGASDDFRGVFVHMPHHGKAPLGFLFSALRKFGGAAVPMVMLVLGGSLAAGLDRSSVHWPTTIAVTLGRLFIMPLMAFSIIWSIMYFTAGPLFFGDEPHLEAAVVVALIVSCSPTANNVVVMAELWGGAATKQALGAMIFVQYCVAPFSLTAWIIAVMMLLRNDGNAPTAVFDI